MADLKKYKCISNSDYEILTPDGFKDFKGLFCGENPQKIKITFTSKNETKTLICTPEHKIVTHYNPQIYKFAKDLQINEKILDQYTIADKTEFYNEDLVYEFLHIEDSHVYYANDVLSHQCLLVDECAWIEPDSILEDFWRSVWPTISRSSQSKCLVASTPRGTGNLFHRLVDDAEKEQNGFHLERIMWDEIPGRDEKWKQEQIKILGSSEAFLQEFCVAGNTLVTINTNGERIQRTAKEIFDSL
jgi:hypothetical protein